MRYFIAVANVKLHEQGTPESYRSHGCIRNIWTALDREYLNVSAPFGGEREGLIRAVPGANPGDGAVAPVDDGSEHGIDPVLEVWGPPTRRLELRGEASLEIEGGVERRVLAGVEPRLAGEHGASPPVLEAEPGEDVDQALVSQLGPVATRP